jgi:hypothetical protein
MGTRSVGADSEKTPTIAHVPMEIVHRLPPGEGDSEKVPSTTVNGINANGELSGIYVDKDVNQVLHTHAYFWRKGVFTKFPFRIFRSDEIRERLSESFRIKPPLSRVLPGNLLVN